MALLSTTVVTTGKRTVVSTVPNLVARMATSLVASTLVATIGLLVLGTLNSAVVHGSATAPPTRTELCSRLRSSTNPFFGRIDETVGQGAQRAHESKSASVVLSRAQALLERGALGSDRGVLAALAPVLAEPPTTTQPPTSTERVSAHWLAGLALLRIGELNNCLAPHLFHVVPQSTGRTEGKAPSPKPAEQRVAEACIVPLAPSALHREPEPAAKAMAHFLEVLRVQPRDARAAWLANLAAALAGRESDVPVRYRLDLTHNDDRTRRWRNVAPALAVDALDLAGGAALEDLDGDGRLDLVTSTWDPCAGIVVFHNEGTGGFRDVTTEWGLGDTAGGLNLFTVDYDGDGRIDLFVTRGAWLLNDGRIANSLLRNESVDGTPRFRDVTSESGLMEPRAPTQAAVWADFDNDGDLDLYLGNEATSASPHPSNLFRNDGRAGDGIVRFTEIGESAGVINLRYAKAVTAGDIDNDGDVDLYVSNFGSNRLYLNQWQEKKQLVFEDRAASLAVVEPSQQSFATWMFDFDNDGDLDLFVADYRRQPGLVAASYFPASSGLGAVAGAEGSGGAPLLYRNLLTETGRLGFEQAGQRLGIHRPAMPMGANFGDFDNDGNEDFYLGTGEPDLASQFPNQAYHQRQGRFEEITESSGLGHLHKGHGVAFGDVDNDGDQDLLHQLGGFYPSDTAANALFENLGPAPSEARNHWLTLRLRGTRSNTFGVGARVEITVIDQSDSEGSTKESTRSLHRVVGTGGSFGASSVQLEVGLGSAASIHSVRVGWPGGVSQVFSGLDLDSVYQLLEGESIPRKIDQTSFSLMRSGSAPQARLEAPP